MEDEIILEKIREDEYCIVFLAEGKEVARSKKMSQEEAEKEYKTLQENH